MSAKKYPQAVRLSDGRIWHRTGERAIRRMWDYRFVGDVISHKRCTVCKTLCPIDEFYLRREKEDGVVREYLEGLCSSCKYEYDARYLFGWRRRNGFGPSRVIEDRIVVSPDGIQSLKCNWCGKTKHIIDFGKRRGSDKRGQLKVRLAVCKECTNEYNKFYQLLRRCRERFGRDSDEFRQLQSEGWKGNFKEVSRMLGIYLNRRVSAESTKEVRASMQRLWNRIQRKEVNPKEEVRKNDSRQVRNTEKTVLPMPEVQI